ncbi:hypothetical protein HanRHA438_Chr11g0500791 [Helianthus annuus]|uniref:Uncharacterized protein n=1 Tax=Helianthus annuus TaxID=4232 RepID=A0A251UJE1_HELAN|nr:hypothetical protein HanXRQr2_Chr11g0488031 [Helianthus annuus]KAJ0501346.1 hypothetical protein HanHA300_Chr11g0399781 [Helianthus annuus]KAJ0509120.1 hypothetical protein HanIR_Chr11g0525241 [Helianthus annuus]KAJ0517255.1 hypothetical protein HanHA89_Chr11g0423301 [Helianthus annuus]KAJ0685265.1 hypothetical protein HanLR1_Chr11g0400751 [Helianthus annuus]
MLNVYAQGWHSVVKGWIERVVAAGSCVCETPATDSGGVWLIMVTVMWVAAMGRGKRITAVDGG